MAAFKLIILKSKFSHDIIPEHTHTHGHVYIFPFGHKHLQAFCLLATSHMINLGCIAKKVTVSGTAKELGLWPLHRQPLSSCQQSLRQGKILQTVWWPPISLTWWRNRPELWMPWARKSWTMIAWRSLLPATPCSQMGPAQGTPPLWLPKLCRQFQLFCLHLLTVLHLLEEIMAPRQKPWGLWSWGQTHAHQEEGQWFGYCHEEASF